MKKYPIKTLIKILMQWDVCIPLKEKCANIQGKFNTKVQTLTLKTIIQYPIKTLNATGRV